MTKADIYDYFSRADENARKVLLATLDGNQCKADIARTSGVNKVTVSKYVDVEKGNFSKNNLNILHFEEGTGKRKFKHFIQIKHDIPTFIAITSVVLEQFSDDQIKKYLNSKYVRGFGETSFDKFKYELILFYFIVDSNLVKNHKLNDLFKNLKESKSDHLDKSSIELFINIIQIIDDMIKQDTDRSPLSSLRNEPFAREILSGTVNDEMVLEGLENFLPSLLKKLEDGVVIDDAGNILFPKKGIENIPEYLRKIVINHANFSNDYYCLNGENRIMASDELQIDVALTISMIFGGPVWDDYKWIISHSPTALKMICLGGWRNAADNRDIPIIHGPVEGSMWNKAINDPFLIGVKKRHKDFAFLIEAHRKGLLSVLYHSLAIDLLRGKANVRPEEEMRLRSILESFDNSKIWINRNLEGLKNKN